MKTNQRLTKAYQNARIEHFDENSKFVFFSDCHRGIGNLSDDFTRNQIIYLHALNYYFKNDFVYIEAGDGDELWENSSFEKNKSAHMDAYKLIKKFHDQDKLIMLYGNHNISLKKQKYIDKYYSTYYDETNGKTYEFLKNLKPIEALLLKNKHSGQEILTLHGHQGDINNDQLWPISKFSSKYFWRYLHAIGGQNPSSPVKNVNKRHKIERAFKKWIAKNKMILICGHTHSFKYPKGNDLPYFNIGCCVYPTTITAIEIINSTIQLVRWRVLANDEGVLQVVKSSLGGPDPIEKFDMR